MNTEPPIVGVPFLPWFEARPRDRIGCPALSAVKTRMATGVPNREMMHATAAATMTALMGEPPQDPDLLQRCPGRATHLRDVVMMRAAGRFLRCPLDLCPVHLAGRHVDLLLVLSHHSARPS